MLKRLEDLRFSIGAFFFIVGILLLVAGVFPASENENSNLNLITGGGLTLFGLLGLAASLLFTAPEKANSKN